jgi:hypothetical protein
LRAVKDLCDPDERVQAEVGAWIISEDFHLVCAAAGVDPGKARTMFIDLIEMEPPERREYVSTIKQSVDKMD